MPHLPKTLLWVLDPAYFTDALVSFLPQCVTDICENTLPGNTFFALNQPCAKGSLKGRKRDRKSTRLNSSHGYISYAVFCLKKKTKNRQTLHIYPSKHRKVGTDRSSSGS